MLDSQRRPVTDAVVVGVPVTGPVRCAHGGGDLRQARRRRAGLQYSRLDDRLRVRVRVPVFREETDKDGNATLADLPARAYVVRVCHPQLEVSEDTTRKTVDMTVARTASVEWSLALKPDLRVRRAPVADHSGHY